MRRRGGGLFRGPYRRRPVQHRGNHGLFRGEKLLEGVLRGRLRGNHVSPARDLVSTRGNDHGDVRDKFHHGLPLRPPRIVRVRVDRGRQRYRGRFLRLAAQAIRDLHEKEQKYEQLSAEKVSERE